MTRKERVVAEIEFAKQALFILVATCFAVIGWLFMSDDSTPPEKIALAWMGIVIACGSIAYVYSRVHNKFKELGELP